MNPVFQLPTDERETLLHQIMKIGEQGYEIVFRVDPVSRNLTVELRDMVKRMAKMIGRTQMQCASVGAELLVVWSMEDTLRELRRARVEAS